MAITRSQQAKQMLQDGGMLVKLRADGKRPGYATADEGHANDPGFGDNAPGDGEDRGRDLDVQQRGMTKADYDKAVSRGDIGQNFSGRKTGLERAFGFAKDIFDKTLVGRTLGLFGPKDLGIRSGYNMANIAGPVTTEEDDEQGQGDNYITPTFSLNSQLANAPSIVEQESEDEEPFEFSRRFRAEGGIMNNDVVGGEMDFESARQMYGLGKLVRKVTRSVKKIAKSPIGKAAIGYALTGGLSNLAAGKSFGANFFSPTSFISKGGIRNIFTKQGLGNIGSSFGLGSMVSQKTAGDAVAKKFVPNMLGKVLTSPTGLITGAALIAGGLTAQQEEEAQNIADETGIDIAEIRANPNKYLARRFRAEGGSMDEPVAKKTMPLLDMDGKEMDLRAEGGFVPIGRMEKADDVPARLSKNEFVFTADAVRNAGEGDVDKGAEVMYNMMKNLESGGEVSEESQGLEGARKMFQTSQRLEEVL